MKIMKTANNNIDKKSLGRGDGSTAKELKQLASEGIDEREIELLQKIKYEEALDKYLQNNPGKTERDFDMELLQLSNRLADGGKVIDIRKYMRSKEPKGVKISLSDVFDTGRTVESLSPTERDSLRYLLAFIYKN